MAHQFLLIATMMHLVLADDFNTNFIDSGVTTATTDLTGWLLERGIASSEVATSSDFSRYPCDLDA